jgi:hypothetical protein
MGTVTRAAEWPATLGITAFILKYRVLRTGADVGREADDFHWIERFADWVKGLGMM